MGNTFSVTKNGSTRDYIGGEMIYFNDSQVKQIWIKKNDSESMIWQYDVTAPTLYCSQATGVTYYRNGNAFTINGTVSDTESGVKYVSVDGNIVTTSSGSWSTTVYLSIGSQTHTIVAEDNAGNKSYAYVYTYYDTTAPSIVITSSTAVRNSPYYTLTGYVSDSQSGVASVSVNGTGVGTSFSLGYTLGEGITNFTISAIDRSGNSSSKTISIIYVNTGSAAPVSYAQAQHGYGSDWHNISIGSDGWWSQTYSDDSGPTTYGSTARTWTQMQVCFRKKAGVKYMYSGISTGTRSNCYHTWRLVTDSGTIVASGDINGEFTCTVPDAYISRSDLYLYVFGQSFDEAYAGSGYVAHSSATVKIKKCTYGI